MNKTKTPHALCVPLTVKYAVIGIYITIEHGFTAYRIS